jgi:hypothetical protein
MRLSLGKRYSPLSGGLTGGMVASAILLLVWLPLVLLHASHYGVAPDLSFHGWSLATTWAGPLGGFVIGALAFGVGIGLASYNWLLNPYARHRVPWRAAYWWHAAILLVMGIFLVLRGLPAVSDVTIAAPRHIFGLTQVHGEPGMPFGQPYVTVGRHNYIVPLPTARAFPGSCVSIIYGPHSMTAFSVREMDVSAPSQFCSARGIGP